MAGEFHGELHPPLWILLGLDVPLSLIADTAILPLTIGQTIHLHHTEESVADPHHEERLPD
jgi:hypothetical protein